MPSFNTLVLITSGTAMVRVSARNATAGVGADESVNDKVKLNVPAAVGVPEIMPVRGSRTSPGGRLPLNKAQVTGALPPKKFKVLLYPTPTTPAFSVALVVV